MILNNIDDESIADSVWSSAHCTYYQSPGAYLRGARKPHYPVPAVLRYISWEYDWGDEQRGWKRGVYMHIRSYLRRQR